MAKRKKHHKKKHRQTQVVQKRSTQHVGSKLEAELVVEPKPQSVFAQAGSSQEAANVQKDVLYGLILIGFILVLYLVLFLLLQNPTVSNSVYGLIKLPNIGN